MSIEKKLLGTSPSGGDAANVADVFSTYLFEGNSSAQTHVNGIDLDGEGGLVWFKSRDNTTDVWGHQLYDTEQPLLNNNRVYLKSESTAASSGGSGISPSGFNSNGFTGWHFSESYASWTFRKAPRFFDVVTYTGDGTDWRGIAHNLEVPAGFIAIKRTDDTGDWWCSHISRGYPYWYKLNTTDPSTYSGASTSLAYSYSNALTFTLASGGAGAPITNINGASYVAYLFAHDPDGENDDGMIACGSVTISSQAEITESLGWEPQCVLLKRSSGTGNWFMFDTMRGLGPDHFNWFYANDSMAEEVKGYTSVYPTADGFGFDPASNGQLSDGTYIYMAIRAPMMKEPEAGTEVFDNVLLVDGSTDKPAVNASFNSPDLAISADRDSQYGIGAQSRDRLSSNGKSYFNTASTAAEADYSAYTDGFSYLQKGIDGANAGSTFNMGGSGTIYWMFKRAKGFFDVVAYTGNGVNSRAIGHNLGVKPELMLIKSRSGAYKWNVYHESVGATGMLVLNTTAGTTTDEFNDIEPTSTTFSLSLSGEVNGSTITYIAYLFATLAGVSKCGNYTGNGSNQNIACGFSGGARFVLIKRTDSTGDWFVWDTERGIVTGNDPHLSLNSTSADVISDDSIDPQSAGFTVNQVSATNINVSSGEYIFLAIA